MWKPLLVAWLVFCRVHRDIAERLLVQARSATDETKLRAPELDTVIGKVSWTGEQQYGVKRQIDAPFYIGQIKGGKSVIVAKCTTKACE